MTRLVGGAPDPEREVLVALIVDALATNRRVLTALLRVHAARTRITGLTCDKRSRGVRCGQPAEHVVVIPGLDGHCVVCADCARFYAKGIVRRLRLTRDAYIAAGNVLDQMEHLLAADDGERAEKRGGAR